jgi:hypothetical protein
MVDSLANGSLFAELQISAWPLGVTQTLLRKNDGQRTLTIRGKPSGRLRVALEREGYQEIVVHTLHLRLRAPTILKVNVSWRGTDVVVAAAGQVIGSSREFDPKGVVAPAEVEQTAAPIDHVDNARARDLRRRQVAALFSGGAGAHKALAARWLSDLGLAAHVLADLATLVRQGRRHHLPGLVRGIRQMAMGDDRHPALLQSCAALIDAPLAVYVPAAVAKPEQPARLLAVALDVASARDKGHGLEMDLDVWLRHDVPWVNGASLPLGWLLKQTEDSLAPARLRQGPAVVGADMIKAALEPLCAVAGCLCLLAAQTHRAGLTAPDEPQRAAAAQ